VVQDENQGKAARQAAYQKYLKRPQWQALRKERLAKELWASELPFAPRNWFPLKPRATGDTIRAKLRRNWAKFQGEPMEEAGELAMASC